MRYPRYPNYKNSGVEWLGDVPEGWEVFQLKRNFRIVNGSTPKSDYESYWGGTIPWVTPADLSNLSSFSITDSGRKITAEGLHSCGTTLVSRGSLILSTRAPIGSLAITDVSLCTNQGCKALVPHASAFSRFYAYVLMAAQNELNVRGKGTTFLELSREALGAFESPVPPFSEQQAIAAFLDHETSRIDGLLNRYQALVDLLKEKRQALIGQVVTKGLNPDVRMKDSGVEWLGKVPEHWKVVPIKAVATCNDDTLSESTDTSYLMEYAALSDVYGETGVVTPRELLFEKAPSRARRKVRPADILLGTVGASLRTVVSLENPSENFVASTGFAVLRSRKIEPRLLLYLLQTEYLISKLTIYSVGVIYPTVSPNDLMRFRVPLPSRAEQRAIVSFLDQETSKIDRLIETVTRSVELLKERRATLISEAVTGKIDVRPLALVEKIAA